MNQTRKRERFCPGPASFLSGLLIAALVLLAGTYGANRIRSSSFYSQSRLISMIVRQDQVDITDMAGNKRNVDMMRKFAAALTSAYINFEMIPVNEVSTFVAVFESAPASVEIDKFGYQRKNLTIQGSTPSLDDYEEFLSALRGTEHFESVSGHYYLSTDGDIRFTLECSAYSVSALLEF